MNKMKLWFNLPVLISLIQHILAYNGIRLVEEVGSTLCPYTNYCYQNSSREINETNIYDLPSIPSCLPCSCDNDCWELHTCCPDKDEIIPTTEQLPCKLSNVKENPDDNKPSSILDILYQRADANYRIVDSCPPSENNETLRRKCDGLKTETLSDYIWVSDDKNGRIYQNVHCSKCHGVKDIWYWNLQTSCQEILDTAANIEDTLLTVDCDITNVAPRDKTSLVAKYQCYDFELEDTLQSGCNFSTVYADLSKDILTACNRSTWPYIHGFQGVRLYNNIFCYVCQFGIDAIQYVFALIVQVPHRPPSFSAIINYVNSQDSKKHQPHTCYSSQIYDPYLNKCRGLMCPFGRYPLYGSCEQKFSSFESTCLCVKLFAEIQLDYDKDMQQMNYSALSDHLDYMKQDVVSDILELINMNNAGCVIQSAIPRNRNIDRTGPTFNASFRMVLGPRCDLYNVTETVIDLTGKTTIDRLNSIRLDIPQDLDGCFTPFRCILTLRLDNDMACPYIELFLSDAYAFSYEQQKERSVFLTFFDNGMKPGKTSAVKVCVENYLKKMNIASGGCSTSDDLKIFVLFSMLMNSLSHYIIYLTIF